MEKERELCMFNIPRREYIIQYSANLHYGHTMYTGFVRCSDLPAISAVTMPKRWSRLGDWNRRHICVSVEFPLTDALFTACPA
jgi:hypothetical protein